MKRALWDVEVSLTVASLASGSSAPPYTITLPLNDLAVFEYVRNLPLPDDDVLVVNLVHAGLSPWPVCGKALQCLVDISKPFAFASPEHSDLEPHMRRSGTSLYPLLLCADALCLTQQARKGLDGPVKTLLTQQFTPLLLMAPKAPYMGFSYVQLTETWAKMAGGPYVLENDAANSGAWAGDTPGKAEVLLPVARWAVLELFHLLDVLCMEQAQAALARLLVDPGAGLLWGDIGWVQQLKQQATSDRLSAAGRQTLFAAALATGTTLPSQLPLHVGPALQLNMKDVVLAGKQLCHGAQIKFHGDSCVWLPLVISK